MAEYTSVSPLSQWERGKVIQQNHCSSFCGVSSPMQRTAFF